MEVNIHLGETYRLHLQGLNYGNPHTSMKQAATKAFVAYCSPFNMEVTCSSEKSVDYQWIIRCYIPDNGTLHNHCLQKHQIIQMFCIFKINPSQDFMYAAQVGSNNKDSG
jgi:hypothetical protein